ncbi:hypothetical protein GCM10028833_00010 [Glycomyces tarimensis]
MPYGVYDLGANTGWVSVGTDADTADFAIAALRRWWQGEGRERYSSARRLLVTADAGGSNGYRVRLWKTGLAAFAAETDIAVTVLHFPPGTSKWNKIEHRLFAQISSNWRGKPLTSHEAVVSLIGATRTRTGLRVTAEFDPGVYPTGKRIPAAEVERLPITPHDWHGEWNYTLRPEPPERAPDPAFGRFAEGDKCPAWLHHPAITGMSEHEWTDLNGRYRAFLAAHPTVVPSRSTCLDRPGLGRSVIPPFGSQARCIDDRPRPVDLALRTEPVEDGPMQLRPERGLRPLAEAPVHGLVGDAEGRRQVPPPATGGQHEHDRSEDLAVIDPPDASALRSLRRGRDQRLGDFPQTIGHKAWDLVLWC